jgi:hypothetical protein
MKNVKIVLISAQVAQKKNVFLVWRMQLWLRVGVTAQVNMKDQ